jgi:AraC family transcriptional regulator
MIPGIESKLDRTKPQSHILEPLRRIAFTWSCPVATHNWQPPSIDQQHNGADNSVAEQSPTPFKWALAPWQEKRAKKLMSEHLAARMKIEEVARACNLSRSHFSRAFKANTGLSPLQWLTNSRLEQAKELLRSGNSAVSDVALACGFCDQSHLTRVFSRHTGSSPSAWRRHGRATAN